jgi:adenylosuccinate synthase
MERGGDVTLAKDVPELAPFIRPSQEVLTDFYASGKSILLEGTQGSALSLYHGPYPHVTSRDTTVSGCLAEAGIPPGRVRRVVMVVRTYPIRVANPKESTSGPMVNEIDWDIVSQRSGLNEAGLRAAEKTSTTKRDRRVSEFDWALLRRAALLNGPTDVALTFADYLSAKNSAARRYDQLTSSTIRFIEEVEDVSGAPVSLISTRFHERSIIDRRFW